MPELFNETAFAAALVPLIDRAGRNVFAVVVKATFELGTDAALLLASEQDPVRMADEFTDNAIGSLTVPSDLVDHKPGTDVIVLPPQGFPERNPYAGRQVGIE